eukprot:GFKZ01014208.1.p3 GENE.GFKZ01014208.1~~GFKZ01014208.1.p3  ORF type:complete len:122 (+),score=12.62 GFKZ01014208.1:287-652(+)
MQPFLSFVSLVSSFSLAFPTPLRSVSSPSSDAVVLLDYAAVYFLVTLSSLLSGSLDLTGVAVIANFVTTLLYTHAFRALQPSLRNIAQFPAVLSVLNASMYFSPSPLSTLSDDTDGFPPLP